MNSTSPITTVDAIIFGFFLKRPMSAYDVAREVAQTQVDRFLKISVPAVYKSCKRLHAAGFLEATTTKASDLPEKTVYTINALGREQFQAFMSQLSVQFNPFYLDCNVLIWNLDNLTKAEGVQALASLRDTIAHFSAWIEQHEKNEAPNLPFTQRAIIKQYRMTVSSLLEWCTETLEAYKKEK
jgi:DNA-binding PadR family transcriptional regulator